MARHKADPRQFLARLEAALKKAKPRDEVNQTELAEILGMTARNLVATYLKQDPAFPILERGSEGKGYRFQLAKVLRHLIKQTRAAIERNERVNSDQARRLNFSVADEDQGVSLSDLRIQMDLTIRAQAEKRGQNDKVDAGNVRIFLSGLNQTIRDGIMGTGGAIDPIGDMEPERRAAFDDHMRDLLVTVERRIRSYIGEFSANPISAGDF